MLLIDGSSTVWRGLQSKSNECRQVTKIKPLFLYAGLSVNVTLNFEPCLGSYASDNNKALE
jgi:hypothetical protein